MKKFIAHSIFLFTVITALIYGASSLFLAEASSGAFDYLAATGKKMGVDISGLRFAGVGISSYNSVTWRELSGDFIARYLKASLPSQKFSARAEETTVQMDQFPPHKIVLTARNIEIVFHDESGRAGERITGESLRVVLEGNFINPNTLLREIRQACHDLMDLAESGKSRIPVEFKGQSHFKVLDRPVSIGMDVVPSHIGSQLTMDKNDLMELSKYLRTKDETLTEAEVDILVDNPALAPRLLRIANLAYRIAVEAAGDDREFSKDAYRHITWSYLLSQEFGEKMAQKVTDAHETGNFFETPEDRKMDFNNNEIGRRYFREGTAQKDIFTRMMQDPRVIHFPRKPASKSVSAQILFCFTHPSVCLARR